MQWYYAVNGQQQGPVEQEVLSALAREGKLRRDDLVWNSTFGDQWAKAATVPGLFAASAATGSDGATAGATWPAHIQYQSVAPNRELMAQAREALAGSWGLAVCGVLVYIGIEIGISLLNIVPALGTLVGFVVAGPLALGWYRFFAALSRRQPVAVGMLFDGFKRFGTAFLATLLMGLLLLAWMLPGIAVVIGAALLGFKKAMGGGRPSLGVILGLMPLLIGVWIPVIIAQLRYAMTYFIINDRLEVAPLDAIRHSTQMMKGNKWKFFCLQCRFIGWALLCLPTFGIGFLWLAPYLMTSLGRFYDELCEDPTANEP
jgi:uncharacterized membrane protein